MTASVPKKILVVALDNLGDTVMAAAILKPLKNLYPQARLGFWVKSYAAGLFNDHSLIDTVHASDPFWDKSPGVAKGKFWEFAGALASVRRAKYDLAFVLNAEWRRALACMIAGVPARIGYDRRSSSSFLTDIVKVPADAPHFVTMHRRLVEAYAKQTVSADDCVPRLEVTPAEQKWWDAWSKTAGLDGPFTVVHLFSGDEDKNWPLTCWIELMERRLKNDPQSRFVAVCGPGEDKKLENYRAQFSDKRIVTLAAPTLGELKAVLRAAKLVIGGDSGLGHVAAALGTPVISLFGPTNPDRSRPIGHGYLRMVQKNPLRTLAVDDMIMAMDEFLLVNK